MKKHNLRVYKAILNRCIRSAKRTYYYKEFTTFKSDSSKTWKLIKDVIKTPQNESNIQEITVNGRKIIDIIKDIIANEFNTYFNQIGSNISKKLPANFSHNFKYYLKEICVDKFNFENVERY